MNSVHITIWHRSHQKVKISDQRVKPSLQNYRSYSHALYTHTLSAVYEPHLPLSAALSTQAARSVPQGMTSQHVWKMSWGGLKMRCSKAEDAQKMHPKGTQTACPKSPKKPAKKTGLVKTLSNLKILCINHHTTFASHGLCCCPLWEAAV